MKGNQSEREQVMIGDQFEMRVVHTSKRHPQVGWIHYEGHKERVYRGSYAGFPVWKMMLGPAEEDEYQYCKQRTMPIEDDPEYWM